MAGSLALTFVLASGLLESPGTAIAQLTDRFARDARILNLDMRPEGFDVEVQDPAVPAHVDRYTFEDGVLGDAEPVAVGRNRKRLEAQLFPLADVDLRLLPRLLADAVEQARTEDGRVTHVRVERAERWGDTEGWGRPVMRVYVDGPRGGAYVEYGLDGKRRDVKRW
ncbi:MAG: hypothetical protein ABW221_22650 [Vicinamibacteria bacterium]